MPRKRPSTPSAGLIPGKPIRDENLALVHLQVVQPWIHEDTRGELHIPHDVSLFCLHLGPALPWVDHTFDMVGTHPPPQTTRHIYRFYLPSIPQLGQSYVPHTITVWRRRAYLADVPGFAVELRWHPEAEEQRVCICPSTLPPQTALKHEVAGLRLLQDLERRGRPPGSGYYPTRESFLQDITPIIQHLQTEGRQVSQSSVIKFLRFRMSVRQFQRDLAAFELHWDDLRNMR
jgi:hypothetical protein